MNDKTKLAKQVVLGLAVAALVGIACRSNLSNLNGSAENRNAANTSAANANAATPPQPATPIGAARAEFVRVVNGQLQKAFFDHKREGHKEIKCISCHDREAIDPVSKTQLAANEPDPIFPGHAACNYCHKDELYAEKGVGTVQKYPFCAVCHTGQVTGSDSLNRPIPVLINFTEKQSEFGLKGATASGGGITGFSHKVHMDQAKMAGQGVDAVRCETCHKFDARGVASSFPGHQECYQCHAHQAGKVHNSKRLGECDACHVFAEQAVKYSPGAGAALRLYKFRHSASHLRAASCERCHRALDPGDAPRLDITQISTARGQRHSSQCWTCHSRSKETGCFKCHAGSLPF